MLVGDILKIMNVIFLGGPGSGKSTLGKRLAEELGWEWISGGAILRESKEPWVQEKLATAQLFDDHMVSNLIFSRLETAENAIIDGYPRTASQVDILLSQGIKIDYIIEVDVPKSEVKKRIALRGREQDSPEIFEERWKIYQDNRDKIIAPLLGSGVGFLVLDGVGTPEEVYERALLMMKNEVMRSKL